MHRIVRMFVFAMAMVVAFWWGAFSSRSAPSRSPTPADEVTSMSLAEKAGQLVMTRVAGTTLTNDDRALFQTSHIGGVILFADNDTDPEQLRAFTNSVQVAARESNSSLAGALIAVDQEGGIVKRIRGIAPWYSAPQIGRSGNASLAVGQGRDTSDALRMLGINMDLAPVADLDEGPNHVMAARSFGALPTRAGRLESAFARGLQSGSVAAALKHFPGLGGATINSDDGKAYVYRSQTELQNDMIPFRFGIASHAKAIMISHGMYVDAFGPLPASVNPAIATDLLRTQLGFTGVAISDSLNSIAWRFGGDATKACPATIAAGVDVALVTGTAATAHACVNEIIHAVRVGTISMARLNEAVERVLELKRWLGLYAPAA